MGPNLTAAEGFILGVGAKMFTIAGDRLRSVRKRCIWVYLLAASYVIEKSIGGRPPLWKPAADLVFITSQTV